MKLSNDMTYERKLLFIYYFSELWAVGCFGRLDVPLADQIAHLNTHKPIKIRVIKSKIS